MSSALRQFSESHSSTDGTPQIALIGCGAIAESYYLPALARQPSVLENLILVDSDEDRAHKLATKFKVKNCVVDYHQTLGQVDGAIIAAPTHLHHPISMEFLSRGVHLLCEKPLAESADKAREMVRQAQTSGVCLAANYLLRLIPSFAKVKELLTARTLGQPLSLQYFVGEEFRWPTVSGFYFNSPVSSRGVLRDRGAHVMDHICWWLGGKPQLICSQNDSFGGSEAVAFVRFAHDQCVGEVKLSWLGVLPGEFVIQCEAGTIEGNVRDYHSIMLSTKADGKKRINLESAEKTKDDIAYKIVTNFVNVISKGEKPLISGEDVLASIEFIDECYAAATRFEMPWYEIAEIQHGL